MKRFFHLSACTPIWRGKCGLIGPISSQAAVSPDKMFASPGLPSPPAGRKQQTLGPRSCWRRRPPSPARGGGGPASRCPAIHASCRAVLQADPPGGDGGNPGRLSWQVGAERGPERPWGRGLGVQEEADGGEVGQGGDWTAGRPGICVEWAAVSPERGSECGQMTDSRAGGRPSLSEPLLCTFTFPLNPGRGQTPEGSSPAQEAWRRGSSISFLTVLSLTQSFPPHLLITSPRQPSSITPPSPQQ